MEQLNRKGTQETRSWVKREFKKWKRRDKRKKRLRKGFSFFMKRK